jgi:hypothetical protein
MADAYIQARNRLSSVTIKRAYCRWAGVKYKPRPSRNVLNFGQDVQKSQGIIGVRVPTPDNSFMLINVDVLKADVPFLIGLATVDAFEMIVDTVENDLRAPKAGWSVPIIRKFGHVYLFYALLRMRPLLNSWAECSVVISCGKVDYDKSG